MRIGQVKGIFASVIVGLVALVVLSGIPGLSMAYTPAAGDTRATGNFLIVGGQDEMKTRNLLPAIANDVWTSDVVFRVYDGVIQSHPTEDRPLAWIAKGVDFDEDGTFEVSEYDTWAERAGATTPLEIVLYYDFNGVRWQDGVQMTPWELFFSYHVSAMNSRFNTDLRVLFEGGTTSQYDPGRQLNIDVFDVDTGTAGVQRNWEGESFMFGGLNNPLRVAVKFRLNEPFALFYESTINPVMLPMHEWSRTGGGRHVDPATGAVIDFGCAIWIPQAEATARGISECGNADSTRWGKGIAIGTIVTGSKPYTYASAESWAMTNADVIGHGPFSFDTWVAGVEAKVVRNEDFYTGVDSVTGAVYDPALAAILHKPTIDGIRYKVYKTTQLGVFALQSGIIDFYHWNVGAEFVPDLLKIPEIAVESNAEPGFFYLSYNMRDAPFGYEGDNPANDVGYGFRQAVSHLIDKRSIVQNLLQNFGVVGHGTLSPANTFWYNDNIPKPTFDLAQANAILDDLATPGGQYYDVRFSLDPPGACNKDNDIGCRSLPVKGNADFEILTPQADYDPVRASAGAMIADAMRRAGINAVSRPTAFGEIVSRIAIHDFDMFILGWRITGTDPDYLFSFFDSSNRNTGQNYPGFNNATFDTTIRDSRAELDRNTRRDLIHTAQLLLAEARPYDVLYYRTNIEGYRQDRYVNWTVSSGTIWNFWSLQGIHPPSTVSITPVLTVASAMASGGTESVSVSVFDNTGAALQDATVVLTVDSGTLTLGAQSGATVTGTTNANGQLTASYQAGVVTVETSVLLDVVVTHANFPDAARRSTAIQVFPAGTPFLSLRLELPAGDRVTAGSDLPFRIIVRDEAGSLVGDADVVIVVTPAGPLTPAPATGTSAQMSSVTLSASSSVTAETDYRIEVTAVKLGYVDGQADRTVTIVLQSGGLGPLCPDGKRYPVPQTCPTVSTPGLEVLPILAGIGIAALVAGVVADRKRRS